MSRFVPSAAIVGAGLMGAWHAHAIARLGGRITAVVDVAHGRAAQLARRWRVARVYDDLPALLEAGGTDPIHVCTPSHTHVTLARAALLAGRHVLVEKPLTDDAAETAALVELAASRRRILVPVHQFGFQRGFLQVERALPRLGRILHVDFVAVSAGADVTDEAACAAVAAEILPHPLSLFARLLRQPLAELTWQLAQPAPGEIRASASCGMSTIALLISMSGRPTTCSLRVIGENASAVMDLFHGYAIVTQGAVSRARKIAQPFASATRSLGAASWNLLSRIRRREPAYPGLRELIREFHLACAGHGPAPIGATELLDIALCRDRILAAASPRRPSTGGGRHAHGEVAMSHSSNRA